jgi:hypothetical protein
LHCEGVEYTDTAIEQAAHRTGRSISTLDALTARGARFDVIHLSDVLTHLPDPAGTFRRLQALLSPGGWFLVDGPLEANASFVLWTSVAVKRLRRRLGRDPIPTRPPTMLLRLTRDGLRAFFTERLGYQEEFFSVYETGWPLLADGASLRPRALIGMAAVFLSRLDPRRPRRIGNRLIAIVRPVSG